MNGCLDFAMEISNNETLIEFKGFLKTEHLSVVREKLFSSVEGFNKIYFINIEQVKFRDKNFLGMFLDFLNFVKEKESELVIIFHNEECKEFFNKYFNIFKIYDSKYSYRKNSGIWDKLKATGITYQKSTGIRLAPSVAIILLILLAGWLLTLFSIISSQDRDIRLREESLRELQGNYMHSMRVLDELKASVAPLKSMGFDIDTSSSSQPSGAITDWQEFLREREK